MASGDHGYREAGAYATHVEEGRNVEKICRGRITHVKTFSRRLHGLPSKSGAICRLGVTLSQSDNYQKNTNENDGNEASTCRGGIKRLMGGGREMVGDSAGDMMARTTRHDRIRTE